MENTSVFKLAVSIAFSLHVLAMPAISQEHGLTLRDTTTTNIHVSGEGECILINGEEACWNDEYHPSTYCVTGDSESNTSATFYSDFTNDPSQMYGIPGCGLVGQWPSNITDVFWYDNTLKYELNGHTYCESCFDGSYTSMLNPYYIPPTTVAAVKPSGAQSSTPEPTPQKQTTQSCQVTQHGLWCAYSILIRIPYIGSSDCDATYHSLEDFSQANAEISNWQCIKEPGNGYIRLWFNSEGSSDDINNALKGRYPSVDDFNCPDCDG